jgi:hypothetical protein
MLTGIKLYAHMNNVGTQAQNELHAIYRRDLDEDQMNELARNAGRRLDWVEKVWSEMSDAEKVAFAQYRISLRK